MLVKMPDCLKSHVATHLGFLQVLHCRDQSLLIYALKPWARGCVETRA